MRVNVICCSHLGAASHAWRLLSLGSRACVSSLLRLARNVTVLFSGDIYRTNDRG